MTIKKLVSNIVASFFSFKANIMVHNYNSDKQGG